MFCTNCGQEIPDDSVFCFSCGAKVDVGGNQTAARELQQSPMAQKKRVSIPIVWLLIIAVLVFGLISYKSKGLVFYWIHGHSEYVQMVKTGYPFAYPDKTYGESFEKFFANPTWAYVKLEDDEPVVQFEGQCMYKEKEVTIVMQFAIDACNSLVCSICNRYVRLDLKKCFR